MGEAIRTRQPSAASGPVPCRLDEPAGDGRIGNREAVALVELGKRGFRVVKGCARNHVKFHGLSRNSTPLWASVRLCTWITERDKCRELRLAPRWDDSPPEIWHIVGGRTPPA